jgi:hypothetical protein
MSSPSPRPIAGGDAAVDSQLATLEVPTHAVVIDAALPPPEQVAQIRSALAL